MNRLLTIIALIVIGCAPDAQGSDEPRVYARCPLDAMALMIGQSNAVGFDQFCNMAVFAKGSTSIAEWAPGGALFAGATNCAGASVETVIWFQGETDAMPRYGAGEGYGDKLELLVDALEDGAMVDVVLIHTVTGYPGDRAVYDAKEATGERTIESADLDRYDGMHLTGPAKAELCGRIWE